MIMYDYITKYEVRCRVVGMEEAITIASFHTYREALNECLKYYNKQPLLESLQIDVTVFKNGELYDFYVANYMNLRQDRIYKELHK